MIAALAALSLTAAVFAADKPNIIYILADDLGLGDLSCYGQKQFTTPNIDKLAADGIRFTQHYSGTSVCAPSRSSLMTGQHTGHTPIRGNMEVKPEGQQPLPAGTLTLAKVLQQAGYATGAFGKWHNGTQGPYHPCARGFDEFYGFCSGHWGSYFDPPLEHNGRPVTGHGYIVDDCTDHALAFIDQHRDRPFLCYVPFNIPHSPMQVPDRFFDPFVGRDLPLRATNAAAEDLEFTRAACAMNTNADWNVGRLLAGLDERGLANDTIVVYFSDNGPNSHRWNGGMKGIKGSTDEGGVREPLLVRWPGHIAPRTRVPQVASALDLLPTLAELCGVPLASPRPLDGRSLAPLLTGAATAWPDRTLFAHWAGRVSARNQRWRLDERGRLFDPVADPGQRHDLADAQPAEAQRLREAVATYRREVLSQAPHGPRPFVVGYPDLPLTVLPARDGVAHGAVERSAKAPNCSFFTRWTSTDAYLAWDVELATAGRYRASVLHTCRAADVGARLELSVGEAKLAAVAAEAFDPPLRGAEHDRVPRGGHGESYVKDFRPLEFGTFDLPAGRAALALRATHLVGAQAIDVRAVQLELLR